jgi:photosystem II stability/assembly factor-like uncharacterized protein
LHAFGSVVRVAVRDLLASSAFAQLGEFQVEGIGGAGGMFTPMGSPVDKNFWLISCDMTGAYRTLDGGKTFEMINWAQMSGCNQCRPCFAGDDVYWALGLKDLRVSHDEAKTWQDVTPAANAPWKDAPIFSIAVIEGTPRVLFVGNAKGLYVSADEGQTWTQAKPEGAADLGCTALATAGSNVYTGLGGKLYSSADSGKTWTTLAAGNAVDAVSAALAKDKSSIVFAVVSKTGIVSSRDEDKRATAGW